MKIAIPAAAGIMCPHFGHCEKFFIFDVDMESKTVENVKQVVPPPHEPGLLPRWLGEMGVDLIIAGGMGSRAQSLFSQNGINVITGAEAREPGDIVGDYLNGTLETGDNACDH